MRKITTAVLALMCSVSAFTLSAQDLGTNFIRFMITDQVTSTIDADAFTVSVTMPAGTELTALVPTFTLSEGATAFIGSTQVSSTVTETDFTAPVTYTIKNGDATPQDWVVTVVAEQVAMINVTFNVTMGECAGDKDVYLTGGFLKDDTHPDGWPEPGTAGSILMTNNGDGTYSTTVEIAANTDDRYKYFVGSGWNGGDLFDGGCLNGDHCLVLGTEDVTLNDAFECKVSVTDYQLDEVSLYPNPVNNVLTISNLDGVKELVISNVLGQALLTKAANGSTMTINTSEFKAGIYVVTIVSENGLSRSERIVKQ